MNLAGINFDKRDLIGRVMRTMRPRRGERNVQRWVLVLDTFAVGRTVAHALCAEFNLDPDEVIK